jgi:nitronate monooxygenase
MWPRTDLLDLLGITQPIIQAPMAGFTTPELAAAVSNAGGLGSLGCAAAPPATVRELIAATRQATNQPFNVNFFVHEAPRVDPAATARMQQRLAPYFAEFGLGAVPEPFERFPTFDHERLDLVLEVRPRIVSFHFGLPAEDMMRAIKAAGCIVLGSATTVAEARLLEAGGADAIIAQGVEAGGHRGVFSAEGFSPGTGAGTVGTMALVPQIADAVRVPVIAAGGIGDGRGIAAAFALGASGAQLGTAFLGCPEASVSAPHRAALRSATDEGTAVTRAFTGRPARALRNRFVEEMAAVEAEALSFPLQSSLTGPLAQIADEQRAAFMPLWAGQAAALIREMPAAELVARLVTEAQAIL